MKRSTRDIAGKPPRSRDKTKHSRIVKEDRRKEERTERKEVARALNACENAHRPPSEGLVSRAKACGDPGLKRRAIRLRRELSEQEAPVRPRRAVSAVSTRHQQTAYVR